MVKKSDKPKEYKYDIFALLKQINSKNAQYFDTLNETAQKAIPPLVVQRWLSGTNDPRRIIFLNELVNPFVFEFYDHKKLLMQLMTTCTDGHFCKNYWLSGPKKGSGHTESSKVLQQMYGYNKKQADDAIKCLTEQQIVEYAEQLGIQKEQIAKIRKEFDASKA